MPLIIAALNEVKYESICDDLSMNWFIVIRVWSHVYTDTLQTQTGYDNPIFIF